MTATHTTAPEEVREPPQRSTLNIATPKRDEGSVHEGKPVRLVSQSGSTRHSAMLEAIYHWLHSR